MFIFEALAQLVDYFAYCALAGAAGRGPGKRSMSREGGAWSQEITGSWAAVRICV